MIVLMWLFLVAVIGAAFATYFLNREFIIETAERIEARKLKNLGACSKDTLRKGIPIIPQVRGNQLSGRELQLAIERLVAFAKETKPEWVLGLHVGGRFLSTYITDVLGLPRDRCLYVSTMASRNDRFILEPSSAFIRKQIKGRILVVDDVSRTGKTLNSLKSFLEDEIFRGNLLIDDVMYAVLVRVTDHEETASDAVIPNWVSCNTHFKYFKLPWTEYSASIRHAYASRQTQHAYDPGLIVEFERLISNFSDASLWFTKYLNQSSNSRWAVLRPALSYVIRKIA